MLTSRWNTDGQGRDRAHQAAEPDHEKMRQLLTRREDFRECLQNAFRCSNIMAYGWYMDDICMYMYQYVSSHITHGEDWQVGHLKHQGGIAKRAGWRKANQRSLRLSPMLKSLAKDYLCLEYFFKTRPMLPLESCIARHVLNLFAWSRSMFRSWWIPSSCLKAYWSCRTQTFTKSQNVHAALN